MSNGMSANFYSVITPRMNLGMFIFFSLLLGACGRELPREEFVAAYEQECSITTERNSVLFHALPLSKDYENAKWGSVLESGSRYFFWTPPNTEFEVEDALFISEGDTLRMVAQRKTNFFEVGSGVATVLAFPGNTGRGILEVYGHGAVTGVLQFEVSPCRKVRLRTEG